MTVVVDILITLFLFSLFGISHTFLAATKLKKKISEKAGNRIAFYRAFYNLSSLIFLLAILGISPKPDVIIYDLSFPYDIAFYIIQILGIIGFYFSSKYINLKEFLGISQIIRFYKNEYSVDDLDERSELKREGWLNYCRHPIYFFSIIIITFRPAMNLFDLLLCISFIIYFYVGARFEENKLIEKYGDAYLTYQKEVPMFIPFKLFR